MRFSWPIGTTPHDQGRLSMRSSGDSFDHRRKFDRSAGFTLLEVLIALVVLSIGLLGIAALQGVGLRSSHGAYLTSQASLLAYDMADRIRANPTGYPVTINFSTDCPEPPLPTTPLAAADLAEWSCSVENLLPEGTGSIVGSVSPLDVNMTRYTIRIGWIDLQLEEGDWSFELLVDL